MLKVPTGLRAGGKALWHSIVEDHELSPQQAVQLTEACRAKDRLDALDKVLQGDPEGENWGAALKDANTTANLMKQLIAALRLPDESGKRPQYRGPRGAQKPSTPGGSKVSSLDRARAAKTGS